MTLFEEQLADGPTMNVNGRDMPVAIWNLILSKRDLKLWAHGLKPHRRWKVTDVKRYFGISGGREKLVLAIEALCAKHLPDRTS